MQQPEKQKALLSYIKKNYGKEGFEIKETVKDTVKFFTPDQSITLECKNNGEIIMVSSRMRRGKKNAPSSELRVNQDTAKRSEKDTKTQTGTGRKKRVFKFLGGFCKKKGGHYYQNSIRKKVVE